MMRYYFYIMLTCMLSTSILFVPSVLIHDRFNGANMAVIGSVILGSLVGYAANWVMSKAPGQGLPEMVKDVLPSWLQKVLLLLVALLWFPAGDLILITYARVIQRFVNPDLNIFMLLSFLILTCGWAASSRTRSILFLSELVLFFNIPMITYILFRSTQKSYFQLDAIRVVLNHTLHMPGWDAFTAASFTFAGFMNFTIFNRVFQKSLKLRYFLILPVAGLLILAVSYLIPIAYHGTYGVEELVYPWISTADSVKMEFAFIERVMFMFVFLYLGVSLMFVTFCWHTCAELIKAMWPKLQSKQTTSPSSWVSWIIFALQGLAVLWTTRVFNEKAMEPVSKGWFSIQFGLQICTVLFGLWLVWRRKKLCREA